MKRVALLLVAIAVMSAPSLVLASANDVGTNPASTGKPLTGGVAPDATNACPPAGVVSTAFTGATSQLGRIFRDGIASACPSKVYPGIFNAATTYNYEAFTYSNTGATSCVTINFDPNSGVGTPCGTNAHMSAYLNSYNPASQATNFLGDVGSSVTQPFSFDVAGGNDVVLVVTNTASQAICGFAFEVVNLPCVEEADLSITKTANPPSVPVGGEVTFQIDISNAGPAAAANVVMTDTLPAGLTYVGNDCSANFSDPTLTWNAGTVAVAETVTCHVTATVDAAGTYPNTATVTADNADPNSANNASTAAVTGQASVLEIPTLGTLGLIALALLVLGAGVTMMLRRRSAH